MNNKDIERSIAVIEGEFPKEVVLFGLNGSYQRVVKTVDTVLKYKQAGALLDVGPGFGIIPRILKDLHFTVTVVDCWLDESSRDKFNRFGFRQALCDASLDPLPFASNTFDVVLLSEVIEHIYVSPKHMLSEIKRVLKPGGILVVTTPNFTNLRKRLWMLMGKSPRDNIRTIYECHPYERHAHEYIMSELHSVLSWSGFEVVHSEFANLSCFPTLLKKAEVEVYSSSPAGKRYGYPVYDRNFILNNFTQWLKLPYIWVTECIPTLRDTLLTVSQKPLNGDREG